MKTNGIECRGTEFSLYANGEKLGVYKDTTFARGRVGVCAESTTWGGVRAYFDNLSVWPLWDTFDFSSGELAPERRPS